MKTPLRFTMGCLFSNRVFTIWQYMLRWYDLVCLQTNSIFGNSRCTQLLLYFMLIFFVLAKENFADTQNPNCEQMSFILCLRDQKIGGNYVDRIDYVAWSSGRVLFRKDNKYFLTNVAPKKISDLLNYVVRKLRLKTSEKEIFIGDTGPDSSYKEFSMWSGKFTLSIDTWQMYSNVKQNGDSIKLGKNLTSDSRPLTLREFYDSWKCIVSRIEKISENGNKLIPVLLQSKVVEYTNNDKSLFYTEIVILDQGTQPNRRFPATHILILLEGRYRVCPCPEYFGSDSEPETGIEN